MARKNLTWVLAETEYETLVQPEAIRRAHGPKVFLTLRPCAQGKDENDCVVRTLYCTRDGRFFVRKKKGWYEVRHTFNPGMVNHKGGSAYPKMRDFGNILCHKLIAHAWLGERPEGEEIDHINADKLNWSADNLRYVTPRENMRSARNMHRLQKMGIDPRWLHRNTLLYIYELNLRGLEYFTTEYKILCDVNPDAEMSVENIEKIVMMAYMNTRRFFFALKSEDLDVRYQYPILMPIDYEMTEMEGYFGLIEQYDRFCEKYPRASTTYREYHTEFDNLFLQQ